MSKTYILNSYSHSNATSWKVLANLHFFLVRRCWLELLLQLFLDSKHHFELSLLGKGDVGFDFLPHNLCHFPRKCVNIHN